MKNLKIIAVSLALITLSACAAITGKMAEPAGISATDCFTQGGKIDNSSGAGMCVMGEGEATPIL